MANIKQGIEEVIEGIIDAAENMAQSPKVQASVDNYFIQLAMQARAAVKIKGIIAKENTRVSHPEQYVKADGVETDFDAKSFAAGVNQVDTAFTNGYKTQVKTPRKNIISAIRHLNSSRFFSGLSREDAYFKASEELENISKNGGAMKTEFMPKELYSTLKEAERKVDGLYKLETNSTAAPSALVQKLEGILNKQSSLQYKQNFTYTLPKEVAAAVIVAQQGKLTEYSKPATANPQNPAAPGSQTNVNVHVNVQQVTK